MEISVYNDTGGVIAAAQVVYQSGIRYPSQLPTVALASAAAAATAAPMGITVDAIADATIGYIVITGNYYPIDTSAFSLNADAYLSNTPGAIAASAGTVEAIVGVVTTASSTGTLNFSCLPIAGECPAAAAATPSITSITPNSGTTAGGTEVTLVGDNFNTVTDVTIGGTSLTSIVSGITGVTPIGTVGAKDVIVTATAGTGTLAGGYTYATPAWVNTKSFATRPQLNPSVDRTANSFTSTNAAGMGDKKYSLSFWVYSMPSGMSWSSTALFFIGTEAASYKNGRLLVWGSGSSNLVVFESNGSGSATSALLSTAVTHWAWTHVVVTSTSTSSLQGSVTLYINGVSSGSATGKQFTGTAADQLVMVNRRPEVK